MKINELPLIVKEVVDGKKVFRHVDSGRVVDEENIEYTKEDSKILEEGDHYILFGRGQVKITDDSEAPKGVEAILLGDVLRIGRKEVRSINYLQKNPLNYNYPSV